MSAINSPAASVTPFDERDFDEMTDDVIHAMMRVALGSGFVLRKGGEWRVDELERNVKLSLLTHFTYLDHLDETDDSSYSPPVNDIEGPTTDDDEDNNTHDDDDEEEQNDSSASL